MKYKQFSSKFCNFACKTETMNVANIQSLIQVKAFARQDGLLLSLVWIASLLSYVYQPTSIWGTLFTWATPFVVGYRLRVFRDRVLDGKISYRRSAVFSAYTFYYASLVFAMAQFVYLQFIDHGQWWHFVNNSFAQMAAVYAGKGISMAQLDTTRSMMQNCTPIEWTFIIMMQNFFIGTCLSFIIPMFVRRQARQSA